MAQKQLQWGSAKRLTSELDHLSTSLKIQNQHAAIQPVSGGTLKNDLQGIGKNKGLVELELMTVQKD